MHRVANVHQDSVPHTPAAGVWEPVEAKWSALYVVTYGLQKGSSATDTLDGLKSQEKHS